jgi:hypothetical protein
MPCFFYLLNPKLGFWGVYKSYPLKINLVLEISRKRNVESLVSFLVFFLVSNWFQQQKVPFPLILISR